MPQQPKRKPKIDQETLLSPTGAAELLNRDRATLKRALRNVQPDGYEGGQPRFKLSTVIQAMESHARATGRSSRSSASAPPLHAELDALEQASRDVEALLRRLRAEPDVERRRTLARSDGKLIGLLDRAFATSITAQGECATLLFTPLHDRVVGSAISELMTLCHWAWGSH